MGLRYIGEIATIQPTFDEVNILWLKKEDWRSQDGLFFHRKPAMWFEYKNHIYFAVGDYELRAFEDFNDWVDFDQYNPGSNEFEYFLSLHPTFYKLDYERVISGDLDEWCQFELDFMQQWWRNKQIENILKSDI